MGYKMKILFVVHNFIKEWKAGVENYTYNIAKELSKIGFEVAFLYPKIISNSSPEILSENYENFNVYTLITNNHSQLFTELENEKFDNLFADFLTKNKFDIIHFHHLYGLPLSFVEIAKEKNSRIFFTLHDFWLICPRLHFFINGKNSVCNLTPNPISCAKCLNSDNIDSKSTLLSQILRKREKQVKELLNSSEYISAPSEFVRQKFKHLDIYKEINIVPLGLPKLENLVRHKIDKPLTFGYIGSIASVKNVPGMVRTFAKSTQNHKLLVYGNGFEDLISELKKEISQNNNIEYRGEYSYENLGKILSEIDVIIIPSYIETYSFTVREALLAHKAVIASNVGGIPDVIKNNGNGLLFSPYDEEELSKAIKKIINYPKLYYKLINSDTKIKTIEEDADFWSKQYLRKIVYPKVSIIIPVFNKLELTKKCINAIFANTDYPNYEIIIVDNASTDGTKEYLSELSNKHQNIKTIINEENLGFSKANNLASEIAEGKYIHFLNNDTQVQKYWLCSLVETAEKDDKIYAVGSLLLFPNHTIQHTGVIVSNRPEEISPVHTLYKYPQNIVRHPYLFQVLTAASLLVRKDIFFKVNKFDEKFWNGYEDVDLCFKLTKLGGKLVIEPRSEVIHYESQSGKQRFIAVEKNVKLLNDKWRGNITRDFIVNENIIYTNNYKTGIKYFPEVIHNKSASIIIVTYNSSNTIKNCINSVLETIRINDEVIVVDNNSTDNTLEIIKQYENHHQIKIIKNKKNLGFSVGCNIGIENSTNPFIVLLNPDTVVYGKWLDKLIYHFNNPKTGAVGPLSNYVAGLQKIEFYINKSEHQFTTDTLNKYLEKRNLHGEVETKLLIGFCLVLKRDILNQVGTLEENLFLGNDDLELSWRLRLAGYKLIISPDTFILHKGQESFNSLHTSEKEKFTKESEEALYNKLLRYYGEENVPTPKKIWDIDWFNPQNAIYNSNNNIFDVKEKYRKIYNIPQKDVSVSLIVPVYNQFDNTSIFLSSLGKTIPETLEVIIINNNSEFKTKNFLIQYAKMNSAVKVVNNEENIGFPKAINQGIRIARGKYIFVANNDVILPSGWLENMIEHAERNPQIGLVGPISNKVSGVQKIKEIPYSTEDELFDFMERVSETNKGKYIEFPRIAFLFTLIKREVIDKIGGLDERFTPGNYEDDDFCLRAQLAGFKTVIALNVFVHHYGSASFTADGVEKYEKLLKTNEQKFIDKWGATPDEIWIEGKQPKQNNLFIPTESNFINYFNNTNAAIAKQDYNTALENIEKAIAIYDFKSDISLRSLLMLGAKIAKITGNINTEEDYLKQILELTPDNKEALTLLTNIYEQKDDFKSAIFYYENALKINFSEELKRKLDELINKLNQKQIAEGQ